MFRDRDNSHLYNVSQWKRVIDNELYYDLVGDDVVFFFSIKLDTWFLTKENFILYIKYIT